MSLRKTMLLKSKYYKKQRFKNYFSQKCIELDLLLPTKSSEPGLPAASMLREFRLSVSWQSCLHISHQRLYGSSAGRKGQRFLKLASKL